MEQQVVIPEIALAIEKLGFNEECLCFYNLENNNWKLAIHPQFDSYVINTNRASNRLKSSRGGELITISAPLWQQVINWFREKHEYSVSIHVDEDNSTPSNIKYWYCIDSFFEVPNNKIVREGIEEVDNFNSYQEAREQAILKAIKLIKK